ncbi:MAG: hypothetical protein E7011_00065 [Alphaproteobacteria bacterium]|nr:hypothetical protein [Alphaproteobacteria bacterium]
MQNKKNQSNVGQMIQRCHKWRQKRKQYIDQARQTSDEIERERLLQTAEHYGRMVNTEQGKIDSTRDPKEKAEAAAAQAAAEKEATENPDEDEPGFPDFITNLK